MVRTVLHFLRVLLTLSFQDYAGRVKTYKFKPGDFYSRGRRTVDKIGHSVRFAVILETACYYSNPPYNTQINKFYGASESIDPHKNSMRLGWQPGKKENQIELYAYYYINGQRNWEYITSVHVLDDITCTIERLGIFWHITVGKTTKVVYVGHDYHKNLIRLYPYFGGRVPAPHAMGVKIYER